MTEKGKRRKEKGEGKTENGERRMENGEWRTEPFDGSTHSPTKLRVTKGERDRRNDGKRRKGQTERRRMGKGTTRNK